MTIQIKTKSNELRIIRVFDAPIQTVWDAWTDPEQVGQWWGPRGFTLTTHSRDLRTGGHWNYTMHGPDGTDYPNKTTYLEVQKPSKLIYDHGANDEHPALFRVTVFFSESVGETKMDMTMTLPTPEAAEDARKFIKKAGGDATWDRLAEFVDKKISGVDKFVINRSFDAPIDVMFDMWTKHENFSQWLPPVGFTMKFIDVDVRPGGHSFYSMSAENGGFTMYGRAEYLEINKPNKIIYTQQFCDEKQNVTRHPMAPTYPATMKTTIHLTEEGPNRTRVTVTWEPYGQVQPEEIAAFVRMRAGMTQGWTGSFDKLEKLLSKR